jgi:hypothetical protein
MNDMVAVKFLLNRFNGKDLDTFPDRLSCKGKLDSETNIKLNNKYFSEIISKNNV